MNATTTTIRRTALALPTLLALALAPACTLPAGSAAEGGAARAEAPAASAAAEDEFSVYDLGSVWTDQAGASRELASLGGRVQVLAMVYTRCSHTCPLILAELKRIEGALTPAERGRVGFTLVSLDPARDTPARLAEYAASVRLDPARWTLLTGPEGQVRDLAALLGIRYRPEAGGEYSHSNTYFVLDPAGRIVHRQTGLGAPEAPALDAIRRGLR